MVFSNDVEWNNWESSFDSNFWMTIEERNVLARKEQLAVAARIHEEREAAETLFCLFGAQPTLDKAPVNSNTLPALEEVGLSLGTAIEEATEEIVGNPFDLEISDDGFPLEPTVHEIQRQDVVTNQGLDVGGIELMTRCTVIPVDNDERDRREEERVEKLEKEKSSVNTIIKYTEKHKGGIHATERARKRKCHSNIDMDGNKKTKTGNENAEKRKMSNTTTKKKAVKKNAVKKKVRFMKT